MKDSFKGLSVIIVDDDPGFLETLQFLFNYFGCTVTLAKNGEEGYQRFMETKSDIIISDIRMPISNGLDFLDHVVSDASRKPPFVFLSGFAEEPLDEILDRGADLMVFKPTLPKQLFAVLTKLLQPLAERWKNAPESSGAFARKGEILTRDKQEINIGKSGFFASKSTIKGFDLLKTGDYVDFSLFSPLADCPKLEGVGQVRWIRNRRKEKLEEGCGIEFVFLSDACREKFVASNSKNLPRSTIPKGLPTP
jgi:CheY-like chemotaxis protein